MPELPEVETVRRGLTDRLKSFVIKDIEVLRDRAVASPGGAEALRLGLQGQEVGEWSRRGKYLMAQLHEPQSRTCNGVWGVHLRMTGQFQWHPKPTSPCRHTRVRIWNQQDQELRFVDMRSFGEMWFVPRNITVDSVIKGLQRLGPEPFSEEFDTPYLQQKLRGSTRSIKAALLDQTVVAGAGNIYADESLFAAGIAPHRKAGDLNRTELERLISSLVHVLEISIGAGGTTFSDFRDLEGVNGNYGGQASVYRRTDQPCLTCGHPIQRTRLVGRSTHWCSVCQS